MTVLNLKKYNSNNSAKSQTLSLVRNLIILLFLFPIFSCTDQGCIEADDFGDYEYQTLTIPANGLGASCSYDYSLDIDDSNQGSGLISYLTTGNATVTDSSGNAQAGEVGKGCSGFNDANLRNLCINDAVQKCLSIYNAGGTNTEPFWTPTGERDSSQNYGVTITPGAEITIKALGSVKLGNQISFSQAYVSAVDYLPTLKDEDLTKDLFFDVKAGQTMNIKFSGKWNNGTENIGGGSLSIGDNGDEAIYNGARRAALYLIPSPYGYKFNSDALNEQVGTLGVPLLPDTKAWQCSYSISSGTTYNSASCSNKSYSTIGYTNISSSYDDLINSAFPFTSSKKSETLGQYGGMIRWNGDGIVSAEFDPFASSTPTSITQGGIVLGNASSEVSIPNGNSNSYNVSFRSTDSLCNIPITVSVKESNDQIAQSYESRTYPINITLSNTAWSHNYQNEIALEPNQKLVISPITNTNSSGNNCGQSIQIKFTKYHDIEIKKSGLVSFTMLNGNGVASNKCDLHGSIINPSGSHLDDSSNSIKADFYEYDPMLPSNPLYNLEVFSSVDGFDNNWSGEIFVRKGQKIRFSPESWNKTWVSANGITNCGVGMAMKISPRPALLCRGKKITTVDNPLCVKDYSSGRLQGCLTRDVRCSTSSPSTFYCPETCQKPIINCLSSNPEQKTGCSIGATPTTCVYQSPATETTCQACANIMLENANRSATESKSNIDQCYDLENYTGKVSNIPSSTGIVDLTNSHIAKGAVELGDFNGEYGNFSSFIKTETVDSSAHNNNKIYQTISPAIFSQSGRIKLLLLDGSDFLNLSTTYNNNSSKSNPALYSGLNGFSINFSGTLEYSNGEMLAARLCSTASGGVCNNLNPTDLNPLIVEYNPTSSSTIPLDTSNYYFSSSGNLIRKTSPTGGAECLDATDGKAVTVAGSDFYCHNQATEKSKMRLTFKIIDPEATNCIIPGTTTNGILLSNPAYNASVEATRGAICGANEIPSLVVLSGQTKCTKEYYCANKYTNNSGQYLVTVKTKKIGDGNISQIISNVVTPVVEIIDGSPDGSTPGQAERMYKLLISDSKYQTILSLCLGLMITFYAMATLSGVSEIKHSELVNRVIKIGLIYLFVGPEGWYWFNEIIVKFFKNGTDYLAFMMASSFDNSPEITTALQNNDYYDKSILFSSVDNVFNLFFSDAVQKKISGLLFANVFGFIYMWIIYLSFMLYVGAVCHAVLYYLTAQVIVSILFIIAPLFFVLTLFGQTKEMFDNWLKQLIGFSLQQIFLLVTLSFFNMMMYEVLKMSLGYKVCWDVVWSIKIIGTIDLLSFWTIPSASSLADTQVGNISGQDSFPSLFSILFIWVVASLMNKFIGFMTDLASGLAGSMKASALGGGIKSTFQAMHKYSKDRYNDIYKGSIGKQIERLDEKLFDSGAKATAARKAKQEKHYKDAQNKDKLRNIGNNAVEEFKRDNARELIGLNAEEQRNKLEKVKNDSMIKFAKENLGLSEDETKKLFSSKGSTYEGSNLFGLALHSGRQLVSGGGTLTKSINDEGVSIKFSEKQAKSAIKSKRMEEEDRKKFVVDVEKGKIKVDRNALGQIKGFLGKPITSLANAGSSVKNSVVEGYDSVRSAMGAGSYREAEKALEERGDIKKMAYGTSFARTDEEKKKIEDERTKILATKKDKELQNKLNNPYAIKNVQKEAEKISGIKSSKNDEERVTKNSFRNRVNALENLNIERKNLEAKEFEISDGVNVSKQKGQEMDNNSLNKNIDLLKQQKTYSSAAKSLIASMSDGLLYGKDKENRNRINRDLKDLKRIRKLKTYDESAKMAHQKYEQDKQSLRTKSQERSLIIGEKNVINTSKDALNKVTGNKAFKNRAEQKKDWKESKEGKIYQESKESAKNFEKNMNLDKGSAKGVSRIEKQNDRYVNPDKKTVNPSSSKNNSKASDVIGGDLVGDYGQTNEASNNLTTRQNLISDSNSKSNSEENFNPMISQEVAQNSKEVIENSKENDSPKPSMIDNATKEKTFSPFHHDEE